ncbi:MAG: hypothetical protein HQ556_07035 [Candidatus Marinimicrobia bacterium]|nr:hypothetical protein [Candidatus Neomarinimicrobiota bacterium]
MIENQNMKQFTSGLVQSKPDGTDPGRIGILKMNAVGILKLMVAFICCTVIFMCGVEKIIQPTSIQPEILEPNSSTSMKWGNRRLIVKWQGVERDSINLSLMYHQTHILTLSENIANSGSTQVKLPLYPPERMGLHYRISILNEEVPIFSEPFSIDPWTVPEISSVVELSQGTEYLYRWDYGREQYSYFNHVVKGDSVVDGKTYKILEVNGNYVELVRVDTNSYFRLYEGEDYEVFNFSWHGQVNEDVSVTSVSNLNVFGNAFDGIQIDRRYSGIEPNYSINEYVRGFGLIHDSRANYTIEIQLVAFTMDGIIYGDTTRYVD